VPEKLQEGNEPFRDSSREPRRVARLSRCDWMSTCYSLPKTGTARFGVPNGYKRDARAFWIANGSRRTVREISHLRCRCLNGPVTSPSVIGVAATRSSQSAS
jgi:hypothetical protein